MIKFTIGVGILFCCLWAGQLIFAALHNRWTNRIITSDESDLDTGVSIIHPIKDLDFELEKNLESWMKQNYRGPVQHIFSFQDPEDPALEVVRSFKEKFSEADIEIIVNPIIQGLNGKSSNMVNGIKLAKYDMLLFGDSDVRIKPDFIVKMIRPLKDEKTGVTTCGQMNIGGKDFWTRYFTFLQNSETDFIWAFLCKLGVDIGMTGAAFAMRRKLLEEVGGLATYGNSLLEDLHLGNTLYKMGYKIVLGPFIECHVNKLEREKSFNYARRIATGVKAHIAFELPAFVLMLFWYWMLFIAALIVQNTTAVYITLAYMGIRTVHGLMQRVLTHNRIMPVDIIMPLFFDVFGTFYLLFAFSQPEVTWRGITYEVKKGGYIEELETKREQSETN